MTCIVGIAENGKMYMGSDSQVSFSWHNEQNAVPKVIKNGLFLMGATGDLRFCNILRHQLDIPVQPYSKKPDDDYIVVTVVEHIRQRCKDLGYVQIEKNRENIDNNALLIGYKGNIYHVSGDFSVLRNVNNIAAIGSGYPFALGALEALKRHPVEKRIRRALEIAGQFAYGVDRKINIEMISQDI